MTARGIGKFKCATMAEAAMLGSCGVADVVVAYQLIGPAVETYFDVRDRYSNTAYKSIVDSSEVLSVLARKSRARGVSAEVMIDLDVGMGRTGISIGDGALELYKAIADTPGVVPAGIHAYDGHVRESDPGKRTATAAEIYETTMAFKGKLERAGLPVPAVVLGGTPAFPCYAEYTGVELSPGTCFLHDGGYLELCPDMAFTPAALVFGRVLSKPAGKTITVDCGSKAVSPDSSGVRGRILNLDGAIPGKQSEEHWVFTLDTAVGDAAVGDAVYILPTHICTTVALYDRAVTVGRNGEVTGHWPITARDRV
jgi:D-serine deaminase-like pyridoxal phosphate-dependent protein